MSENVLEVKNLCKYFDVNRGMKGAQKVIAVDGISFEVKKGETFGLVGESGCGKSTLGRTILRIYEPTKGEIVFEGEDISRLSRKKMLPYRQKLQMIFQDPMTSLNPTMKVGKQIEEMLKEHRKEMSKADRKTRAIELLSLVGISNPEARYDQYPHQLSGGMRQRVVIAIALACDPKVLIADEPTTALDVTIQEQILDLMRDLQKKIKTSIIIITHNLGVVANIADRVAVMYGGKLVETGDVEDIFHNPCHEYTKGLLRSIPKAHEKGGELQAIPGTPPDLMEPPVGCPFAARCKETMIVCQKYMPDYTDCGKNHKSACWMLDEMAQEVNSDEK
mgnify:CR=1 FL=1